MFVPTKNINIFQKKQAIKYAFAYICKCAFYAVKISKA